MERDRKRRRIGEDMNARMNDKNPYKVKPDFAELAKLYPTGFGKLYVYTSAGTLGLCMATVRDSQLGTRHSRAFVGVLVFYMLSFRQVMALITMKCCSAQSVDGRTTIDWTNPEATRYCNYLFSFETAESCIMSWQGTDEGSAFEGLLVTLGRSFESALPSCT
jgi:hypothetical protein